MNSALCDSAIIFASVLQKGSNPMWIFQEFPHCSDCVPRLMALANLHLVFVTVDMFLSMDLAKPTDLYIPVTRRVCCTLEQLSTQSMY